LFLKAQQYFYFSFKLDLFMATDTRALYLDLLKKSLSDILNEGGIQVTPLAPGQGAFYKRWIFNSMVNRLATRKMRIISDKNVKTSDREEGKGWPVNGQTMIGLHRLENIHQCLADAIKNNVPGDFIETGVWRGGACIFARAIMKAYDAEDRTVWVADSFAGLPKPNVEEYPEDAGDDLWSIEQLRVSQDDVKANFEKYDMFDENHVKFLKGWFKDTLPTAPIDKLAVMRLDGDMYESTMDGLVSLYPKLSVGGYCIIDDFGAIEACAKAVHDYREKHGIDDEIIEIDWSGRYWKKTKALPA
jgi:O-methyltransferase